MRKRVRFHVAIGSLLLASTMSIIIPMSDIMASANSAHTHKAGCLSIKTQVIRIKKNLSKAKISGGFVLQGKVVILLNPNQ